MMGHDMADALEREHLMTREEMTEPYFGPAPRTNTRQFCQRCRNIDRIGFLAPRELWKLVAGPHWEHSILCLACFAEIGDEKGIAWDVPELEFYPVSYATLNAHRGEDLFDGSE